MKFSVINLGCKVNSFEAESISAKLVENGWQRTDGDDFDAVVIFTCAVTNTAASKSRKMMHRARRTNPDAVCVVAGCYVQIDDGMLDEADILVGSMGKEKIPEYLDSFIENHQKIRHIEDMKKVEFTQLSASMLDSKARGELKIQDGCNQFCTFCIIPYARGRERSMQPDLAVKEAVRMSEKYHEIVLTGIHTGRYGSEYGVTLTDLLKRMLQETTDVRFRISSIEITEVTDELLQLMKQDSRIARFLHIPLQSGSNQILREMHRPYTVEQFYDRVQEIRNILPDVSISTDLITGFPGESDELFEETYEFLKKCAFSFLHVFPYSERKGTVAAVKNNQVDMEVRRARARKCIELSTSLEEAYRRQFVGKQADIICEWVRDGYTTGHTSEYIPVKIEKELVHGEKVHVQCIRYEDHFMIGEVVEDNE